MNLRNYLLIKQAGFWGDAWDTTKAVANGVGQAAQFGWNYGVKPAWNYVVKPTGQAIGSGVGTMYNAGKYYYNNGGIDQFKKDTYNNAPWITQKAYDGIGYVGDQAAKRIWGGTKGAVEGMIDPESK